MQEFFSYASIVSFTSSLIIFNPYLFPHQPQFSAEAKNEWRHTSTPSTNIPSEKLFPQDALIFLYI